MYTIQIAGFSEKSANHLGRLVETMKHGDEEMAGDAQDEILDYISQNPRGTSIVLTPSGNLEPLRQIAELHKGIAEIKAQESYGEGVDWDTVSQLEDQIVSLAIDFALATLEGGEAIG